MHEGDLPHIAECLKRFLCAPFLPLGLSLPHSGGEGNSSV